MTATELIVIVGGAALGYWLVAVYLPNMKAGTKGESDPVSHDEPAAPWHEVLGVSEFASRAEIGAAYEQKISQYHPDKVAGMTAEIRDIALTRSRQIEAAYQEAMRLRG